MRYSALLLLLSLPLLGQGVSVGLKFGVPVTDPLSIQDARDSVNTHRWILGPTVEVHLPRRLSVGLEALYRSWDFSSFRSSGSARFSTVTQSTRWEVPAYARYRLEFGPIHPFVNAGIAFDRTRNEGTYSCTGSASACGPVTASTISTRAWGVGFLFGGGVEVKVPFVSLLPEFRYTRWDVGALSTSGQNQAAIFLGIAF